MNFNFDLYEKSEAKEMGEREVLELGGHELVIMDAREYTGLTGNVSLKICVDIAGNDKQKGFFKRQYDNNNLSERKWPNGATKYLSLKDEQISYLKGFITSLEKSNNNFKFNTKGTWEQLKGLKIAGQFGLEEYQDNEGKTKTATKLVQFRSLDKLNEIKIPKVKLLNGELVDYEEYKNRNDEVQQLNDLFGSGVVEISDDDMPF